MMASRDNASQGGKHFRTEQTQGSGRHTGMGPLKWLLAVLVVVGVALGCGAFAYRMLVRPGAPESSGAEEAAEPAAKPELDEGTSETEDTLLKDQWVTDETGVHYLTSDGSAAIGWEQIDSSWYFFDEQGALLKGRWLTDETGEHYLTSDGSAAVGWKQIDSTWYFFDDQGTLLKGQWLTDESGEHYLTSDGSAAVGWKQVDDSWYFFDEQGTLQTGWIDDGSGKRYWVRPEDKTLPHHEWIEIDGVFEPFDDDGAWVNNGEVMPPNDAENVANMTARQQAVIDACDITPWPGRGYCAAWVSDVFVNAGEPAVDGDACDIARAWCASDDLSELKPGIVIAVTTHERTENGLIWGHVCIYAGNGLVRDSGATSTRWVTLGSWFAWYGTLEAPHWGWANGIPLDEW